MRISNIAKVAATVLFAAASAALAEPAYKSVLIEKVPHVKQKPDFCGEARSAYCAYTRDTFGLD